MRQSIAIDVGVESAIRELREGLEPYRYEQDRLLRLLRFKGAFAADDFDRWFHHPRRLMGRRKARCFLPTTPLLGFSGGQFSEWGLNLEILQALCHLGQVKTESKEGKIFYLLADVMEAG